MEYSGMVFAPSGKDTCLRTRSARGLLKAARRAPSLSSARKALLMHSIAVPAQGMPDPPSLPPCCCCLICVLQLTLRLIEEAPHRRLEDSHRQERHTPPVTQDHTPHQVQVDRRKRRIDTSTPIQKKSSEKENQIPRRRDCLGTIGKDENTTRKE